MPKENKEFKGEIDGEKKESLFSASDFEKMGRSYLSRDSQLAASYLHAANLPAAEINKLVGKKENSEKKQERKRQMSSEDFKKMSEEMKNKAKATGDKKEKEAYEGLAGTYHRQGERLTKKESEENQ